MSDADAQLEQALRELDSVRCEVFDRMSDELTARIRLQDARNRHAQAYKRVVTEFGAQHVGPWKVTLFGPRTMLKS